MRPLVKYHIIYMNRERYSISAMCCFFEVSRSGYYNFVHRIGKQAHDFALSELIRAQQEKCDQYLRIQENVELAVEGKENIPKSENNSADHEEVWTSVRNSASTEMAAAGSAGSSIQKLAEPAIQS